MVKKTSDSTRFGYRNILRVFVLAYLLIALFALHQKFIVINELEKQVAELQKQSEFIEQGKRFTYDDGIMLYNICQKQGYTLEDIQSVYGEKNTSFKEYLKLR